MSKPPGEKSTKDRLRDAYEALLDVWPKLHGAEKEKCHLALAIVCEVATAVEEAENQTE